MKYNSKFQARSQRLLRIFVVFTILLLDLVSSHAANILFVVNSLGGDGGPTNANDQEVVERLTAQGHKVTAADDTVVSAADLTGMELVIISSSVGSGEPGVNPLAKNTLRAGRIPVINYEPALNDELLLQTADTYGNANGHTSLAISVANKNHPLAAGKSGTIEIVNPGDAAVVSSSALPLTIGKEAIIIATNATPDIDVGRIAMWAYDTGSHLADNTTVIPSRRVALFYNASTPPGVYNKNATDLFDVAVKWVLENRPSLAPPFVPEFSLNATGVNIRIEDGSGAGATQVNTSSVKLSFNGSNVTPEVKKSGSTTTVIYRSPALLAANSQHKVELTFADSAGKSQTTNKDFTLAPYNLVPASFAVKPDTSKLGFRVRVHQVSENQGNTLARTEDQLAGRLKGADGTVLPNIADLSAAGPDGFFTEEGVVNYNQDAPGNAGNFNSNSGFEDKLIPGIPGIEGGADNIAAEILTFLDLPAGLVRMGVNSDDGFLTSVVVDPTDKFPLRLGFFDGGRGAADTLFEVVVEKAGVYPFRTIWEEGQGGANLEWFSVAEDGKKILINDKGNPSAIKAYRVATGAGVPIVKSVSPQIGATGVAINAKLELVMTDGASPVDQKSVQLSLNGAAVSPIVNRAGKDTTVSYTPLGGLSGGATQTAKFVVADSASPPNTRTIELTFTTEKGPIALPAFEQSADGLVVIEAENFHAKKPSADHDWVFARTPAGYSGDGTMYALPDSGAAPGLPSALADSPRLDYKIKFTKTGTHYFWFRGSDGGGNSLHAGIDDVDPTGTTLDNMDEPGCCGTRATGGTSFAWVNGIDTTPDGRAKFQVSSAGEHTLHIWMREDGQIVDKILVASEVSFTPTGTGPAESLHVGGLGGVPPKFNLPARQGNNLMISWTGTGTLQQADAVTGPWTDAPSQNNSLTVTTGSGAKFYRIRQ